MKTKFKKMCILLLISLGYYAISEAFYKILNSASQVVISTHIIGYCLTCLLFVLLYSITGKLFPASLIMSLGTFLFLLINQLKIIYSADPVFLSDIGFLNSPGTFMDIMTDTIWSILYGLLPALLLLLLGLSAICVFCKRWKGLAGSLARRWRLLGVISTCSILLLLLLPIDPIHNLFIKNFYEVSHEKNNNTTSNVRYYFKHSVLGGLYGQYITTLLREPETYDVQKLEEELQSEAVTAQIADTADHSWGTPNIIMVFSESFWDMDRLTEVTFDKPLAGNLHKLSEQGQLLEMISPTFGGISSNTEFEIMTGGGVKFFPTGYIPYMNLYNSDAYYQAPSVIQELKRNGYETRIYSAWDDSLFNCAKVYDYFGVDQTYYETDFPSLLPSIQKKGGRISDDSIADLIISEFSKKEKGKPLFSMVLTAEAHMPYYAGKYAKDEYSVSITDSKLSEEEADILRAYAQGVYDADQQLAKLYNYIQTLDEPTLLIFYGDHLPFFKTSDGVDIYGNLEYFNTEDADINVFRKYNTQCILLDNYDVQYDKSLTYLGPDLLMSYVLNHTALELSPFYVWLDTTKEALPAANNYVAIDKNGQVYNTNNLPQSMQDCFELRQNMNWKQFVDLEK